MRRFFFMRELIIDGGSSRANGSKRNLSWLLGLCFFVSIAAPTRGQTGDELLARAESAHQAGQRDRALELVSGAIREDPENLGAFLFRAMLHSQTKQHGAAIDDFSSAIELDPARSETYNLRGMERFKMARIEESIRDFDKAIELRPDLEPYHWQRGIAYYYAGRYRDGRRQFEIHRGVNPADVENAVWHFLCVARVDGFEKARDAMLPVRFDRRVPMMEVDALFRGTGTAEKVLEAAREGSPPEPLRNRRLFYADLYLGLYHEALGDSAKALEHIRRAAHDYGEEHYMADVARVHLLLAAKDETR